MFLLYEELPRNVDLSGVKYELNLAFDSVLYALKAISDPDLTDKDKLESFLNILIIGHLPSEDVWLDLYDQVINLLSDASPETAVPTDLNGNPIKIKSNQPNIKTYDSDFDAQMIYAAFKQAYGIDLIDQQGKLHWYKYQALLNALPENTMFYQVRNIRNTNLSDIKDKEQRHTMAKLKEQVALPDEYVEKEGDMSGS
ncbi:Gp15 family bacteriophage protein [Lapidilactobacillus gannanensis]|uniref:Gp15 family bacteriophage protein n=1 Tax=Lapidilactobacillus gannanensis TaxID=2486002 RepID=A0ABW4BPT8_9LACO|nr:Gp15 family bacteriophage protein [Lapidilactobacillus gannanensis]